MTASVVVALQTFWATVAGQPILVSTGQRYWSDHPVVVAQPTLFAAADPP